MLWPLLGSLAAVIVTVLLLSRRFDRLYAIEERRRAGLPWDDLTRSSPVMLGCGWAFIAGLASLGIAFLVGELLRIGFLIPLVLLWASIFALGLVAWRKHGPF